MTTDIDCSHWIPVIQTQIEAELKHEKAELASLRREAQETINNIRAAINALDDRIDNVPQTTDREQSLAMALSAKMQPQAYASMKPAEQQHPAYGGAGLLGGLLGIGRW